MIYDAPSGYNSYQKIIQSSSGPKKASNRKSAGIEVAGNLVTGLESVSRFEFALIVKKLLTRY